MIVTHSGYNSSPITIVVKPDLVDSILIDDNSNQASDKRPVDTILDRLLWILENRKISQRKLGREAGLGDNHISVILHRLRADPSSQLEHETLAKIAAAVNVSSDWLALGTGSPDKIQEQAVEYDERYPNRALAIAFSRGDVSEEAIARVKSWALSSKSDPAKSWWVKRLVEEDERIRQEQDPEWVEKQKNFSRKQTEKHKKDIEQSRLEAENNSSSDNSKSKK